VAREVAAALEKACGEDTPRGEDTSKHEGPAANRTELLQYLLQKTKFRAKCSAISCSEVTPGWPHGHLWVLWG
jgi:hypothetical protein